MFVAGNFLSALAWVLDYLLYAYMWMIVIRALISWVNPDPYNPIVQFLYKVTEPVLDPIRRMLGTYSLGIDISPMIVILLIMFLQRFLVSSLYQIAGRFG